MTSSASLLAASSLHSNLVWASVRQTRDPSSDWWAISPLALFPELRVKILRNVSTSVGSHGRTYCQASPAYFLSRCWGSDLGFLQEPPLLFLLMFHQKPLPVQKYLNLDNSYELPRFSAFQLFMQSHVQTISGHASPWECPRLETKSTLDSKALPLFQFSEAVCLYSRAPQLDLEQQAWTFPQEGAEPRQPQRFAAALLLTRRRVDYPSSRFRLVHTYWDHQAVGHQLPKRNLRKN